MDTRPLRAIFPTAKGHRLAKCPACGAPCAFSERDASYRCNNLGPEHPDWWLRTFGTKIKPGPLCF